MVSVLTLSFLLTGTVHPNSWPRLESESLGKLTTAESHHYHPGQHGDTASNMLEAVSHAVRDHGYRGVGTSRPSSCGPADQ
ncbi:hypothetical protein V8E53_000349, partial [Lactarius tabidus]